MESLSQQVIKLLEEQNNYSGDISNYCSVLSFLPLFEDIKEEDYIVYHNDQSFEYTPQFYSFIKSLFDAGLVEDVEVMNDFLKSYSDCCAYKLWMKEMNCILSSNELLEKTNLCFIKKAVFSMIRLERVLPGSWGIDVETGNWLALLHQLKRILKEIYKTDKSKLN
jgi:hypothetical protein